jgi:hypothetical protein
MYEVDDREYSKPQEVDRLKMPSRKAIIHADRTKEKSNPIRAAIKRESATDFLREYDD